ncbi:MAG: winged helix-turn-helix domain-containing tetratricopeptide repeat protein, partial [Gammaproteobacteria bacterium]
MNEEIAHENKNIYTFGPFRLDVAERRLLQKDEPVPLTRKAFDLLLILVETAGHLKTREELVEALWPKNIVEEQGLTTKMHALRKALGDEGESPSYIETVRGVGYRFIAPVEVEEVARAQTNLPLVAGAARKRRRRLGIGLTALAILIIAAGLTTWLLTARSSQNAPTVVAVLPFENLSTDKTNAYFASGIQDTILTRLAGIHNLRVISRSSTESFSSRPKDLREVANELGATAVLEGSVQKAGNQVLINVQLVNARTDAHIWAATYTRTLDDVFGVEGDVATKVAAALMAKLQPAQAARLARSTTRDPQAYVFFLKANYQADQALNRANAKDTDATMKQAIALYRQAIARDPDFALAWAHLSLLESYAYWFGIDADPQRITVAERAAQKALALDPDLPQAHMAMGYVAYYGREDYAAALEQFRLAQTGLPHSAEVIGAIAYIHRRQGKWQEALAGLRQAAELDPRNSRWPRETAITLEALRRYDQAEQQFDQALALEPDNYDAMVRKTWVLLLAGKSEQARTALAKIPLDVDPQGLVSSLRCEDALFARDPDRALTALTAAPGWMVGADALGLLPKSLLEAEAWTLKGDETRAHQS